MLLYLLVRDDEGHAGSFELDGYKWRLAQKELAACQQEELGFICISYSWGEGRVPSPFRDNFDVSDRTIPALTAAMRHRPSCDCFWIDAFCVPADAEEKKHCL